MTRGRRLVAVVIVCLLAVTAIFLYTPLGLRWTFALADAIVPGHLSAGRLDGRLAGPVHIQALKYETKVLHVTSLAIDVDWSLSRLLTGRLVVRQFHVRDLVIDQQQAAASQQQGLQNPAIPIPLRIDDGRIDNMTVTTADHTALVFNTISFGLDSTDDTLHINKLHIKTPDIAFNAKGTVPLTEPKPVDVNVDWQTTLHEVNLKGHGHIGGTMQHIQVNQTLDQPTTAQARGRVQFDRKPVRWQFTLESEAVPVSSILPQARPLVVGGTISGHGQGAQWQAESQLNIRDPDFGNWLLSGHAQGEGSQFDKADISADTANGPAHIDATLTPLASRQTTVATRYRLEASWKQLSLTDSNGDPVVSTPSGSLQIEGAVDDYRFTLQGDIAAAALHHPLSLTLQGSGRQSGLQIAQFDSNWLDGAWSGQASLTWQNTLQWQTRLQAQGLNPGREWPQWPGQLTTVIEASNLSSGHGISFDIAELSGTLRQLPVDGRLHADWDEQTLHIRQLHLQSAASHLDAQASINSLWDVHWALDSPALGELYPGLSGALSSQGRITGPVGALQIESRINGSDVTYQQIHLASLVAQISLDLSPDGQSRINADIKNLAIADNNIQRLQLSGDGTAKNHSLTLSARYRDNQYIQPWSGSFTNGEWHGRARQGTLQAETGATWHQSGESGVIVNGLERIAVDHYCWTDDRTVVCIQGKGNHTGDATINADWQQLDLALFRQWLLFPLTDVTGTSSGNLTLSFIDRRMQSARASMTASQGQIGFQPPGDKPTRHRSFRQASLDLSMDNRSGTRGKLAIEFNDTEHASASLSLPRWQPAAGRPAPTQKFTGRLNIQLQNLDMLSLFVPDLDLTPGQAGLNLTAHGTLARPQVDGNVSLAFPAINVTNLDLTLQDVNVSAQIERNHWQMDGNFSADNGQLAVQGTGYFRNTADWSGKFTLKGDNVQSMRLPSAILWLSPDITLDFQPGQLVISGLVEIPKARIEPVVPEPGSRPSPDVVITGGAAPETPRSTFTTRGELTIKLGDLVRLTGQPLEGRLTGQLKISKDSKGNVTGRGEINIIDGKYRAYGQNLIIKQGRLLYADNPIDNPAIDFTAVRQRPDVEVGVHVTGTAKKPILTLVSTPTMADGDILSYLILGRPLNQATTQDGRLLHQAATSLALVGGERMADSIARQFDLEEVTIESGETSADTAIALGKYITPRIYVRYVQSLVDTIATFQIRYQLSDKWMIETESGNRTGGGADLIYTLEH